MFNCVGSESVQLPLHGGKNVQLFVGKYALRLGHHFSVISH